MRAFQFILFTFLLPLIGISQITLEFEYGNPQVPNNLIGFNTGFNHRHWVEKELENGVTSYTSAIRSEVLDKMESLHQPVMRFPGGVIANFYHLYPLSNTCIGQNPCPELFSLGYGLREQEVETFNNGFGAVGSEYRFEQNNNTNLTENWIVNFANLIDSFQNRTGETVDIILMANSLSHFKFGNQDALFDMDTPLVNNVLFQAQLRETLHALKYLIETRGLSVSKIELGTELYFAAYANNNEMSIDRFINLIPIYRDLLDDNGFSNIKIGVPFNHTNSLEANANNWSRKLADKDYNPNQQFDAWILHDYQKMVENCNVVLGNCSNCNNWIDDECSLYNGNPNILNCEPDNHSPSSEVLESVYTKKNERFADNFNENLANEYEETLNQLRNLSGNLESTLWMTEWNEVFDGGCDQWKGINQFFPNTFAHAVNIFDLLHSLNEKNVKSANEFMEVATFHSFAAPNTNYPIINASNDLSLNATYYPFEFGSLLNKNQLKKIEINSTSFPQDNKDLSLHAYLDDQAIDRDYVYLFFTNKTKESATLEFDNLNLEGELIDVQTRYVSASDLHSSVNSEYNFNSINVTATPINYEMAEGEQLVDPPYTLEAMSFGYLKIAFEKIVNSNGINDIHNSFSISPNPTRNKVKISSNHPLKYIQLNSIEGQIIQELYTNQLNHTLDIGELSNGIYLLGIQNKLGKKTLKIIKH